jgi:hypothetical protein
MIFHLTVYLELSGQTIDMFHLKLLINLAPLSIASQIDWHTLGHDHLVWCPPKLGESSGSAPRCLSMALIRVSWPPTRDDPITPFRRRH